VCSPCVGLTASQIRRLYFLPSSALSVVYAVVGAGLPTKPLDRGPCDLIPL